MFLLFSNWIVNICGTGGLRSYATTYNAGGLWVEFVLYQGDAVSFTGWMDTCCALQHPVLRTLQFTSAPRASVTSAPRAPVYQCTTRLSLPVHHAPQFTSVPRAPVYQRTTRLRY